MPRVSEPWRAPSVGPSVRLRLAAVISVHCDNSEWVDKAKNILKGTGAEDIGSAGEKSASTHGVDKTTGKPVQTERTYSEQKREKVLR
jgi:hypothetical protein